VNDALTQPSPRRRERAEGREHDEEPHRGQPRLAPCPPTERFGEYCYIHERDGKVRGHRMEPTHPADRFFPKRQGGHWRGRARDNGRIFRANGQFMWCAGLDPVFHDVLFRWGQRRHIRVFAGHLVMQDHVVKVRAVGFAAHDHFGIVCHALQVEDVAEFSFGSRQFRTVAVEAFCFKMSWTC